MNIAPQDGADVQPTLVMGAEARVSFIEQIQEALMAIGPVGLAGLAFLDSAGIPTGGAPDIALILMAPDITDMAGLVWLVLATVIGSVLGCLVLYQIGRVGGERVLRRFDSDKRQLVQVIQQWRRWLIRFQLNRAATFLRKLLPLLQRAYLLWLW